VVPPSGNVGLGQPIGNQRESARVTRRKVIAPICPSRSLTGVNSLAKFAQPANRASRRRVSSTVSRQMHPRARPGSSSWWL
jgi:hypothetical protein